MAASKASKKASSKEEGGIPVNVHISERDFKRLEAARFMPVVRWVDFNSKSDATYKTVEALTLLDRREGK